MMSSITRSLSNTSSFRRVLLALLALGTGIVLHAAPSTAAEVDPEISLGYFIMISHEFDGSAATTCWIQSSQSNGSFSCVANGVTWTGEIRGVTGTATTVLGHIIRISRPSGSSTLTYEGAVREREGTYGWSWMAGSYTQTQYRWVRVGGRWIRIFSTSGPFPFTGDIGFIDG